MLFSLSRNSGKFREFHYLNNVGTRCFFSKYRSDDICVRFVMLLFSIAVVYLTPGTSHVCDEPTCDLLNWKTFKASLSHTKLFIKYYGQWQLLTDWRIVNGSTLGLIFLVCWITLPTALEITNSKNTQILKRMTAKTRQKLAN